MKKLTLILSFVCVSYGVFSQYSPVSSASFLHTNPVFTSANTDYLNDPLNKMSPIQVKTMDVAVASWYIYSVLDKNGEKGQYSVSFSSNQGKIEAVYDKEGNIATCKKWFTDVTFPKQVGLWLATEYPGWQILKNKYYYYYSKGKSSNTYFKVKISNGQLVKWLKIDNTKLR